tara:strand:- start:203 stop:1207 length:1005 start_codon:yes stop_codon:yes gene_type:complete
MEEGFNKKDIIFLAGSRGMVGSAIKRKLENLGYGKSQKEFILLTPTRRELDLLDDISVKKWFKENKPKIVILAAAKVGGIFANSHYPADFLIENIRIQANVIEASFACEVKRLLFLGSSCIYPKYSSQPIQEEALLTNSLESTNEPYAIAKIAGLKLCEALRSQYGFDAISLMPTNLYGPNDNYHETNSHVMAALIRKFLVAKRDNLASVTCWGSGNVHREFLHVDDLAEAVYFCLKNWFPSKNNAPKDSLGRTLNHLNIGTGKDISIRELAEKIAYLTNFKGNILWDTSKPDGTPKKLLDVSRINKLGWHAKINLDSGLKKTIDSLRTDMFVS